MRLTFRLSAHPTSRRLFAGLAGPAALVAVLAACGSGDGGAGPKAQARSFAYTGFCPDFVLCIRGAHWDPQQCQCVPDDDAGTVADAATEASADACTETMLCIEGDHWDPDHCGCVPNGDAGAMDAGSVQDAGVTASDACTGCDDATPCDTP